ncbi:hypothetical protein [Stutzerimonas stutzeri]|nr:hypothetical protein [Stutzerimonas stutzeri]MCQ4257457.1 hypothetical protein [Stutzerimonas stutzeri]
MVENDAERIIAGLREEVLRQRERHRNTWRKLEQALAELAALKAGGPANG